MKLSIGVSILILAIGMATGLFHQKRLTLLRHDHLQLVAQAEKLGIPIQLTGSSGELRVIKRQREDRENQARSLTADLAAFAREMEANKTGGTGNDEAFQKRGMEIMSKLMELDAAQIKVLITGLRDDKIISSGTQSDMIGLVITMFGEDHPTAALELLMGASGLPVGSPVARHAVASTLGHWSNQDPLAALDWVRKNSNDHPDLTDDEIKQSIIAGAARSDPKLAFKLIAETNLDDRAAALQSLVEAGKTQAQRTAILDALREHLATVPNEAERQDLLKESLESMARNISEEGFGAVQSWIENSKLSPQESAQFAAGLSYFNTKQDTGRWIEWMATNLPKEQLRDNVDNLIGQWTQQDYQSAGKWLAGAPDGPAKIASISAYATTVAEYDPQVAVQWADTLPEGKQRQETYQTILENWPASDSAGASAFAASHGMVMGTNNNLDVIHKDGKPRQLDGVLPPSDDEDNSKAKP